MSSESTIERTRDYLRRTTTRYLEQHPGERGFFGYAVRCEPENATVHVFMAGKHRGPVPKYPATPEEQREDPTYWSHDEIDLEVATPEDEELLGWIAEATKGLWSSDEAAQRRIHDELVAIVTRALQKLEDEGFFAHPAFEPGLAVFVITGDESAAAAKARYASLRAGTLSAS